MNGILKDLLTFADRIGVVSGMHCYDASLMTIEGKTREGKNFEITLHMKEEAQDGD